jgi:hypothetical protein
MAQGTHVRLYAFLAGMCFPGSSGVQRYNGTVAAVFSAIRNG